MSSRGGITRASFLKGAAAAAAATVASTAGVRRLGMPAAFSQSRVTNLTVGGWGGLVGKAVHSAIGESFEKEHGVKIEYVHGWNTARIAKMRAERGRQTLDVAFGGPELASIVSRELNALVPLEEKADLMPRLKDLAAPSRDPKIWTPYSVPLWTYAWTLVYRTDKIPEEKAKRVDSWHVVFEKEFQKRVGWPNINYGPGWALALLAMMGGAGTVESGRPQDVSPGWALLPKLVPQVLTFWSGEDQGEQLLRAGDVWITFLSTFQTSLLRKDKLPVANFTRLKEGLVATNESIAIVRSGDKAREDLAARYINHGLSPEAQMKFAEFFMTPINPKVKLPPAIAAEVLSVAEVQKLNHFDYIWMSTQADKWTEQWNKAISA